MTIYKKMDIGIGFWKSRVLNKECANKQRQSDGFSARRFGRYTS